jgi:EAL domain-containing protein (putative c-di-GMP-specific phosphodiesterase class I)
MLGRVLTTKTVSRHVWITGDGVVTEDEFTAWAKEQALRVELWERQLEDVLSKLSAQVEQSVDQETLSDR